MMRIRRAEARGRTDWGWLDSRHTFSFGEYHDRDHLGFRALRVINDDRIAPGAGFPTHGHRDMEIISWVLSGELAHEDSTGSRATLKAGSSAMLKPPYPYRMVGFLPSSRTSFRCRMNIGTLVPSLLAYHSCLSSTVLGSTGTLGRSQSWGSAVGLARSTRKMVLG